MCVVLTERPVCLVCGSDLAADMFDRFSVGLPHSRAEQLQLTAGWPRVQARNDLQAQDTCALAISANPQSRMKEAAAVVVAAAAAAGARERGSGCWRCRRCNGCGTRGAKVMPQSTFRSRKTEAISDF